MSSATPAQSAERVRLPALWAGFPFVASLISAGVGCLVLCGWAFDIEVLKRIAPGFVAMNPLTALLFILAGIALGVSRQEKFSGPRRWTGRILALVILGVAAAKLLEVSLKWPMHFDQWLFAEKLRDGNGDINQMAPITAADFMLLALSLLTLDVQVSRFFVSQGFALLAGFGALVPITGYIYGVRSFEGLGIFFPMALHTASVFLILAAGLFLVRADTPSIAAFASDDPRGVIARRLLPPIIVLTIFCGWLRLEGERRGYYTAAFGTALYAVTLCVLFVVLVRWAVWTVGRIERERNSLNDDLVESKWRLEESLRETRLIIDHARELICTVDAKGNVCTVNAACDEILGMSSHALVNKSFVALHAADERPGIENAFATAKGGLKPEIFAAHCCKGDSSDVQLHWSIQWSPHYERMFCVGRAG